MADPHVTDPELVLADDGCPIIPPPDEKPLLTGLFRDSPGTKEGKYLVMRRDGSVPEWAWFVLGERDPACLSALRAYADHAEVIGYAPGYVAGVRQLAADWEAGLASGRTTPGDADRGKHRADDPGIIHLMQKHGLREGGSSLPTARPSWAHLENLGSPRRGPLSPPAQLSDTDDTRVWEATMPPVIDPVVTLSILTGAVVLSVTFHCGKLRVYFRTTAEPTYTTRRFRMAHTGEPLGLPPDARFLASLVVGRELYHVFDMGEVAGG